MSIAVNMRMWSNSLGEQHCAAASAFGYAARPLSPELFLWPEGNIYDLIALADEEEHRLRIGSPAECRLKVP